jgi:hypothetical protein
MRVLLKLGRWRSTIGWIWRILRGRNTAMLILWWNLGIEVVVRVHVAIVHRRHRLVLLVVV